MFCEKTHLAAQEHLSIVAEAQFTFDNDLSFWHSILFYVFILDYQTHSIMQYCLTTVWWIHKHVHASETETQMDKRIRI